MGGHLRRDGGRKRPLLCLCTVFGSVEIWSVADLERGTKGHTRNNSSPSHIGAIFSKVSASLPRFPISPLY